MVQIFFRWDLTYGFKWSHFCVLFYLISYHASYTMIIFHKKKNKNSNLKEKERELSLLNTTRVSFLIFYLRERDTGKRKLERIEEKETPKFIKRCKGLFMKAEELNILIARFGYCCHHHFLHGKKSSRSHRWTWMLSSTATEARTMSKATKERWWWTVVIKKKQRKDYKDGVMRWINTLWYILDSCI